MISQLENIEKSCPREEVFAYIDGELSSRDELDFDLHLDNCKICTDELNSQKKVLTTLEIMLEEEAKDIELPEDFTKIITTKAESNVTGLRHRKERFHALLICSILLFIVTIALGTEVSSVWIAVEKFFDQFSAVVGFVFHLAYDAAIGINVILRSLGHKFVFSSALSLILIVAVFVFTSFSLSRWVLRDNRA